MLFLHGALGSSKEILPFTTSNSLFLDFPGHGKSLSRLDPMTIETLSLWTKEQHLSAEKVFGYSMGGYIALYMSSKSLHPFKKIVTYGTKLKWDQELYESQSHFLNPRNLREKNPKFIEVLKKIHGNSWEDLLLETLKLMKSLSDGHGLSEGDFKNINSEVIFLVGSKDRLVTVEETLQVCELNENFKMYVLEDQPHELFKVSPDKIKSFF